MLSGRFVVVAFPPAAVVRVAPAVFVLSGTAVEDVEKGGVEPPDEAEVLLPAMSVLLAEGLPVVPGNVLPPPYGVAVPPQAASRKHIPASRMPELYNMIFLKPELSFAARLPNLIIEHRFKKSKQARPMME